LITHQTLFIFSQIHRSVSYSNSFIAQFP